MTMKDEDEVEEEEEEDGTESFSEWSERVREKHLVGLVNQTTRTITFWSERLMTRKEKVNKKISYKRWMTIISGLTTELQSLSKMGPPQEP